MLILLLAALIGSSHGFVTSGYLRLPSRMLATKRVFNLEIPLGEGYKPAQAKLRSSLVSLYGVSDSCRPIFQNSELYVGK